jgi:uncharacterized protein YfaS (alpha-2-macroglobulin family)
MKRDWRLWRNRWFVLACAMVVVNAVWVGRTMYARDLHVARFEAGEAGVVQQHAKIAWRFSERMVETNGIGRVTAAGPVTLRPPVAGIFRWESGRRLSFQPQAPWEACAEFMATVNDDLTDLAGRTLVGQREFHFASPRLAVTGVRETDFAHGRSTIAVAFNGRPDLITLKEMLRVRVGRHDQRYRMKGYGDANTVILWANLPEGGGATVHIGAGVLPRAGHLGTAAATAWTLTRSDKLTLAQIRGVSPTFGSGQIRINFNRPLQPTGIRDRVSVLPEVSYRVQTSARRWQPGLTLVGDFEPGRSYAVTLHPGLASRGGAALAEAVTGNVLMPNRSAGLTFDTTGHYLSPRGSMKLPVRSVNVSDFTVTARRIGAHNLVQFLMRAERRYAGYYRRSEPQQGISRYVGARVFTPRHAPDVMQKTVVNLRELLGDELRGIFHLAATGERQRDTHLLVVSDIGICVKRSQHDLHIWANQLHSLAPVSNGVVRVHASDGATLAEARTDDAGLARVERLFDGEDIPFMVTVQHGDDLSYLALDRTDVALKGELGGAAYAGAEGEVHLYSDRGIYRPGERVHLVAIRRDGALRVPAATPVALTLNRPDGGRFGTINATPDTNGVATWDVTIPDSARTGKYTVSAALPGQPKRLGTLSFLVETFMPPQVSVALEVEGDGTPVRLAGGCVATLSSRYLEGRVAGDLPASLYATFKPAVFKPSGWAGYGFVDTEKPTVGAHGKWVGRGRLDAAGRAEFKWQLPPMAPRSAMEVVLCGTVTEPSGRAVADYQTVPVDCYPRYIGVRRASREGGVLAGEPIAFELAAVRPDGGRDTGPCTVEATLSRVEWHSAYERRDNGSYHYTSERLLEEVQREVIQLEQGAGGLTCRVDAAGSYLLRVIDGAGGASCSDAFNVSSGDHAWVSVSREQPGALELSLDRAHYQVGERARLTIKAPFAGKAWVSVESDRVLSRQIVELEANSTVVSIPVPAEALPNAYCSVVLIRPVEVPHGEVESSSSADLWMPHRAIGTVPLMVRDRSRKLQVTVAAPVEILPGTTLPIHVTVQRDNAPVAGAHVTVAVVDEAICMLTRYATPDPFAYFTRKRALGVRLSDLYGLLMPELPDGLVGSVSTPGGDAPSTLASRLNPIKARRYVPMVRWIGGLVSDANGQVDTSVAIPEFTGKVRIMAVVAAPAGVGATACHTVVKRAVSVAVGLPRFLAPGDVCQLPVTIHNDSAAACRVSVNLAATVPLVLAETHLDVVVGSNSSTTMVVHASATESVGTARLSMRASRSGATAPAGTMVAFCTEQVELAVRPPLPRMTKGQLTTIAAGETQALPLADGWLPGTAEHRVWCSPLPSVRLAGSLDYILRYPYGCLEQTTSRAFPLLYVADLLPLGGSHGVTQEHVRPMVQAGIRRIQTMQFPNGGFSYWPRNRSRYDWGTHYATHFLLEAKAAGYTVDTVMLARAVTCIETELAKGLPTGVIHGADLPQFRKRAYACYLLALAGKRPHGWVTRLAEMVRSGALNDTESIAYLAAAQTALGLRRDALATVTGAATVGSDEDDEWRSWGTLTSSTKSEALLLQAWLGVDPAAPQVALLAQRLEKRQHGGRYRSTQENAMVLLALGKYARMAATASPDAGGSATWHVDAVAHSATIAAASPLQMKLPEGVGSITLTANAEGPLHCWTQSSGVPLVGPTQAIERGLAVSREWYDAEGRAIALDQIRRGDLVVVRLSIQSFGSVRNVVISELLPAGLEIENARLSTSQALPWVKQRTTLAVQHLEIRDDRLLLFIDSLHGSREFYYVTRAVTAGAFIVPPVAAECMYDESISGMGEPGRRMVIQ